MSEQEVRHLAHLARLALTDDEVAHFTGQLGAILHAVSEVARVDRTGVTPMSHAVALANVTRPDLVTASLPVAEVLAAAPAAEDDRFRVPRILGEAP
ncbi:MAG: Asp-tRNA(Asn)/Glu-tRNA(Gln) amidotransferase subunit GatC [Actinomycetales bacterium]|nr:Asp-tRNA(Asn)/Glu-tRNA(Gln) amidotransferase subunit GatC [Actinomycetales bacterium]